MSKEEKGAKEDVWAESLKPLKEAGEIEYDENGQWIKCLACVKGGQRVIVKSRHPYLLCRWNDHCGKTLTHSPNLFALRRKMEQENTPESNPLKVRKQRTLDAFFSKRVKVTSISLKN